LTTVPQKSGEEDGLAEEDEEEEMQEGSLEMGGSQEEVARMVSKYFSFDKEEEILEDFFDYALIKWNYDVDIIDPEKFNEMFDHNAPDEDMFKRQQTMQLIMMYTTLIGC
jgi:hypothetical protein